MKRRRFLFSAAGGLGTTLLRNGRAAGAESDRPNILLITADDLNYDSLGVTGTTTPDVTPNLDRLASEGVRFQHAHVTSAVCQPSRSVLMTGRYPHRNGAIGFNAIDADVPTLQESLAAAGYLNGIFGKVHHLAPRERFHWSYVAEQQDLGVGRSPSLYYDHAKEFFARAKASGKPFFLMANSHDPHRPFAGSEQEARRRAKGTPFPKASRHYGPEEVEVPGFLPDLPEIRREIAQYYTSVHRCDETVGAVLRALAESGDEQNTLVMFLSDNGIAVPFAKTNCYLTSTRTPWIVRWPGKAAAGRVDRRHFVSGIDFMPTVLDAAGLEQVPGMDGRSFLPLLSGGRQPGRDHVYTVFHRTSARRDYPMRCVQNAQYGYIFNAWADGETVFKNESQSGLTMNAMREAAKQDPEIAARVQLFVYRVPEEFYDFKKDPCALRNLIDVPEHAAPIKQMRRSLLTWMENTGDPLLGTFNQRIST
jgi:N-sulfoglucosamine sulfohydrolase